MEKGNGGMYMEHYFTYDAHLEIEVPELQEDWEEILKIHNMPFY